VAFQGQVVGITLGTGGQSGSKNQAAVREDQLLIAENVTFEDNTIRKEGGAAKYNSTVVSGTPKIIGGHDWDFDGSTRRSVLVTDAGDILRDDGAGDYTATTLDTGLNIATSTVPIFVEGGEEVAANNKKLFVFTGRNAVQVLSGNGASTADLATPPADWTGLTQPVFGVLHDDRLWGGGNTNDPHRLYYSDTADHEDFTGGTSGSLSIFPGQGGRLSWAVSFRGIIIVAKHPQGLYAVDTTDPSVSNWVIKKLNGAIGSPGPQAFAVVDDDIVFFSSSAAIYSLAAVNKFGDVESDSLTDEADYDTFLRDNIALDQLRLCRGIYYPAKKEVHFAVSGTGATTNNRRVVVDFNRKGLPRFRFSPRDTPVSMWLRTGSDLIERPALGDDAGFVWDLDQETRSKDGVGYAATFQTPHLDFTFADPGLGPVNKNWAWLELAVEPKGNHNLSVDVFLDDALSETIQFDMGGTGAVLGSFVLGTDVLAGGNLTNKRKLLRGRSRRISLKGTNSGAAEDFSVIKFYFGFKVSDTEEL